MNEETTVNKESVAYCSLAELLTVFAIFHAHFGLGRAKGRSQDLETAGNLCVILIVVLYAGGEQSMFDIWLELFHRQLATQSTLNNS